MADEITGAVVHVVAKGLWPAALRLERALRGNRISISSPRSGGYLEDDPVTEGAMTKYKVRGRLKRLAKGSEIWLIRMNEVSCKFWPQGFERVVFNRETGEWCGRVNGTVVANTSFRLYAVVAPPTTHNNFVHWQEAGQETGHFVPFRSIPPECTNFDYVQVSAR